MMRTVQGKGSFNTYCMCRQKVMEIALTCVSVWLVFPQCVSISIKSCWWFSAFPRLLTCCGDHVCVLTWFEGALEWKVKLKSLSCVRLFATPWTVACTRLLCPWDFLGQSTGVGCHFLLQGSFPTQGSNPGLPHCRQTLYHLSHQGRSG